MEDGKLHDDAELSPRHRDMVVIAHERRLYRRFVTCTNQRPEAVPGRDGWSGIKRNA